MMEISNVQGIIRKITIKQYEKTDLQYIVLEKQVEIDRNKLNDHSTGWKKSASWPAS